MNIFKKSKKQQAEADRQRRRGTRREPILKSAFSRQSIISFLLYLAFGAAATVVAFVGLSSAGPLVQKDQVSRIRITSEIPFSYISEIRTQEKLEAIRQKVPPVFRLDMGPYRAFRSYLERLMTDLADFAQPGPARGERGPGFPQELRGRESL